MNTDLLTRIAAAIEAQPHDYNQTDYGRPEHRGRPPCFKVPTPAQAADILRRRAHKALAPRAAATTPRR